jgi:ssDNA-binding Zn-finger/Zn-ribbon topoisomerase 1
MFEKEAVDVACPKCGHKSEENVGRLKTDGYTCPNCGDTRDASEFARDIKQVEDAVEKLKRKLARVKKTDESA